MKNNKLEKVFVISITFLMILTVFSNVVYAGGESEAIEFEPAYGISDVKGSASNIGNNVQAGANAIVGIVQVVGMAAAVIMLIVLAIKYVSAAPGEKADIKKSAVIYIIGAVLLLCAAGVLELIKNLGTSVGL